MKKLEKKPEAIWLRRTRLFNPDEFTCSRCREKFAKPYVECPNCGARMIEIKDGNEYPDAVDEFLFFDDIIG